uniref:Uncharacterized protein n=1 Tax=Timema cristinae TaxID=61476 RepID=A0A7R9CEZ3_TIMCR|nr:unnamed protein product [Timema cristinae]
MVGAAKLQENKQGKRLTSTSVSSARATTAGMLLPPTCSVTSTNIISSNVVTDLQTLSMLILHLLVRLYLSCSRYSQKGIIARQHESGIHHSARIEFRNKM